MEVAAADAARRHREQLAALRKEHESALSQIQQEYALMDPTQRSAQAIVDLEQRLREAHEKAEQRERELDDSQVAIQQVKTELANHKASGERQIEDMERQIQAAL